MVEPAPPKDHVAIRDTCILYIESFPPDYCTGTVAS